LKELKINGDGETPVTSRWGNSGHFEGTDKLIKVTMTLQVTSKGSDIGDGDTPGHVERKWEK
jgi:hypothetical protein